MINEEPRTIPKRVWIALGILLILAIVSGSIGVYQLVR